MWETLKGGGDTLYPPTALPIDILWEKRHLQQNKYNLVIENIVRKIKKNYKMFTRIVESNNLITFQMILLPSSWFALAGQSVYKPPELRKRYKPLGISHNQSLNQYGSLFLLQYGKIWFYGRRALL